MLFLQSVEQIIAEIWKIQNNEINCIYRSKNHIGGLWGYRKYLYFMNDFGIYRISIDDPSKEEQVIDKPVSYEYVTFYKDKIYFCLEDLLLYQANLDGSDKKRFCVKRQRRHRYVEIIYIIAAWNMIKRDVLRWKIP